jgi:hypothetical protein
MHELLAPFVLVLEHDWETYGRVTAKHFSSGNPDPPAAPVSPPKDGLFDSRAHTEAKVRECAFLY